MFNLGQIVVKLLIPILRVLQISIVALSSWTTVDNLTPQAIVKDNQKFDFIVVGAGSAGAVLANRLSEVPNWKVLLIEAGKSPPSVAHSPGLSSLVAPALPDWGYFAEDDGYTSQAHKHPIQMYRGKMLGGSSGNNFMFYVRGNKIDYDGWVQDGNNGWDFETVTKYFKKSEHLDDTDILNGPTGHLHSTGGYLGVSKSMLQVHADQIEEYIQAFVEKGYVYHEDVNGPEQNGISHAMFNIFNQSRQSTVLSFLQPIADRTNLYILRNTLARKVIFDKSKRATGVVIKLPNGEIINVNAEKEVILSAGALNSPQILMLSGVGPKDHLAEMNIDLVLDSPMVGRNLQDHPIVPISLTGCDDSASLSKNLQIFTNLDKFVMSTVIGFTAVDKKQSFPDYQVTAASLPIASLTDTLFSSEIIGLNDETCAVLTNQSIRTQTLFALITLLKPKSKGRVKLNSNDPEDLVKVYLRYFSDPSDLDLFAASIKDYVGLIDTPTMKFMNSTIVDLKLKQCSNFTFGHLDYWRCYALNVAGSMWHPSGTCAMGKEGEGVVDERLKVRGLMDLRVVDASVMPTITRGNTNAPTIMIAEKAADMIKEDHGIDDTIYENTVPFE